MLQSLHDRDPFCRFSVRCSRFADRRSGCVEERIDRLTKRSIKKASKIHALKLALSMIDLTTLEGADSPGKVKQMCYKAAHLCDSMPGIPRVAAVCVYPTLVRIARDTLKGTGIKVAAVATGFP